MPIRRVFNYKRDVYDPQDCHVQMHVGATAPVPLSPFIDKRVRPYMPAIWDQGQLGSCTGNANARTYAYKRGSLGLSQWTPSRLAIYWGERRLEGTVPDDDGASIRDGMKVLQSTGAAQELLWPYVPTEFAVTPSDAYFTEAAKHKVSAYTRVSQADYYLGHCLQVLDCVISFGFEVFPDMESDEMAKTGILPMPKKGATSLGWHAVTICGRDVPNDRYLVANSWGADWGQAGYFWMPRPYVLDAHLASDFCAVTAIAG